MSPSTPPENGGHFSGQKSRFIDKTSFVGHSWGNPLYSSMVSHFFLSATPQNKVTITLAVIPALPCHFEIVS
ncbi:MAG TPA: hypothetical protein PKV86_00085 [Syntrophobacteraceae bacterium]|nr:hypothetical protein [Syntrophobacteraceae bacterium]